VNRKGLTLHSTAVRRLDDAVDDAPSSTAIPSHPLISHPPLSPVARPARENRLVISVPWRRVAELAQQIDERIQAGESIDTEAIVKLARTILLFQTQLLGMGAGRRMSRG
jgi:hypothetical protein